MLDEDTYMLTLLGVGVVALLWVYKSLPSHQPSRQVSSSVLSEVDNSYYDVLPGPDSVDAANLLARVRKQVGDVLIYIYTQKATIPKKYHAGIDRLARLFPTGRHIQLQELSGVGATTIAYNMDKVRMHVCIRSSQNTLGSDDVVLYLVLHELTHSMFESYARQDRDGNTIHDSHFRDHNSFIMGVAEQLGYLHPQSVPGRMHCGITMPDPDRST